jgi:hypothetical protein
MSKTYIPAALRELVAAQSLHRCGYCLSQAEIIGILMEIDHIIPESLGGLTEEDNLWSACSPCNGHKADRIAAVDPQTNERAQLFDPRHQNWREHFVWSADGEQIIGLTPTGRATVAALQLNRPSLVTARRLWVRVGWHPPEDTHQ